MGRFDVAVDERPGVLASVARALREHRPDGGGTVGGEDDAALTATGGGGGGPDRTATAAIAAAHDDGGRSDDASCGDDGLLDLVIDQHETLGWHRQELEQTNRGVLALHAELAETTARLRHASDLQRRLLGAGRAARAAAEAARARRAGRAHAGAT